MWLCTRVGMWEQPPGTIYQTFEPMILGPLMIKGENVGDNDWFEMPLGLQMQESPDDGRWQAVLDCSTCREATFDPELRYLVYDSRDVESLIAKLKGEMHEVMDVNYPVE